MQSTFLPSCFYFLDSCKTNKYFSLHSIYCTYTAVCIFQRALLSMANKLSAAHIVSLNYYNVCMHFFSILTMPIRLMAVYALNLFEHSFLPHNLNVSPQFFTAVNQLRPDRSNDKLGNESSPIFPS